MHRLPWTQMRNLGFNPMVQKVWEGKAQWTRLILPLQRFPLCTVRVISWLLVCSSNRIPLELDYRGNRGIIPWGVYYYYDSFVQEGKIYSYIWKWVFMVWKHNFEWISLEVESCLAEVWGKVPIGCQSPTLSHWRQLSYAVSSNRVFYWINIIFDWPLNRLNHKRGWNNKN